MKRKARERAAAGVGAVEDPYGADTEGLFALRSIRGKDSIKAAEVAPAPDEDDMEELQRSSDEEDDGEDSDASSIDMEEEQRCRSVPSSLLGSLAVGLLIPRNVSLAGGSMP